MIIIITLLICSYLNLNEGNNFLVSQEELSKRSEGLIALSGGIYGDLANAIRFLSIDAVQKANSGHPGMPMGMAEIATSLWSNHLKHNPSNPNWFNLPKSQLDAL